MNNPNQIKLDNGFVAVFNEDREWIYKAVPFVPKKKKSKEEPKYKVINEIEDHYQANFEKCLVATIKDVAKYLVP